MEKLDTFLQNFLTLSKMTVMREKSQRSSKRVKYETKRSTRRKKKILYTMEDNEDDDTSGDEET